MFGFFKKKQIKIFPIGSIVYYTTNRNSIHAEKREKIKLIVTDQDSFGWVSTVRADNGFPFLEVMYTELDT